MYQIPMMSHSGRLVVPDDDDNNARGIPFRRGCKGSPYSKYVGRGGGRVERTVIGNLS